MLSLPTIKPTTVRYFIELSYSGKAYNGWQIQPNAPSVQQTLQKGLSTLLRRTTETVGAGRTDTGVHASYYVAHFDSETEIDRPVDFCYHLNALLPHDIAIRRIRPVQPTAHARFDALSRSYEYRVSLRKDPFRIDTAYQVNWPLDVDKMNEAAALLLSHSDFTSFCKLHSDNKTNLCRVSHAAWKREHEDLLLFSITADRFLRNMVRAIVGTLVDVGRGKITVKDFSQIIEEKDRCSAGSSAPPQGLFLCGVTYPDSIYLDSIEQNKL